MAGPEPAAFEAHASPVRIALATLCSAVFVVLGAWLVGAFGPDHPHGLKPMLAGWAGIVLFGGSGLVGLSRIGDRSLMLRVDQSGIWSKSVSDAAIPWSAITGMAVISIHSQKMIGLGVTDPARYIQRRAMKLAAGANERFVGCPITIGVAGTTRSFAELEGALVTFSERAD